MSKGETALWPQTILKHYHQTALQLLQANIPAHRLRERHSLIKMIQFAFTEESVYEAKTDEETLVVC